MFGKWGLFVLAALASAAVLTSSAGAVTQGSAGINVSTRAGVVHYLASLGVSARGVVVQRGAHNYAGPNCPGKGWTCTTAKRVLQIAKAHNDDNNFVCAGGGGFSNPPGDCEIVQFSTNGANNVARCTERSGDASADQNCTITQNNTTGNNSIQIQQQVDTKDGVTQAATQYAGTRQTNGTGRNDVQINQDLKQSVKKDTDGSGTQTQDGHQQASVTQDSDSGNNTVQIDQSLAQKADAKGGPSITQLQNTDGDVNSNVGVVQFSNTGGNDAHVNQSINQDAHVGKADTATQTQGSTRSGENEFFLQQSDGVSHVDGDQSEHQDLHAEHVGALTQTQYGPQWMDPDQGSNPNDRYDLDQNSDQHASDPDTQDNSQYAECHTTGNCTADEHIHQQGQHQDNSCSGSSCDIGNFFNTSGEGSQQGTCSVTNNDGSCTGENSPPPPPPAPEGVGCEFDCRVVGNNNGG